MDLGGATEVDTYYEFMGYRAGAAIAGEILWNSVFVALVVLGAILRLYYTCSVKGEYMKLVTYPFYVAVLMFLFSPVEVTVGTETIWDPRALSGEGDESQDKAAFYHGSGVHDRGRTLRVPGILAVVHEFSDGLLFSMAEATTSSTQEALFQWDRIAAASLQAAIYDPQLSSDFDGYLGGCYWPGMAISGAVASEHLPVIGDDVILPALSPHCKKTRTYLKAQLSSHIHSEDVHRRVLSAYRSATETESGKEHVDESLGDSETFKEYYLRRLVWNETFGAGARNEMALLSKAVPEYSVFDPYKREKFVASSDSLTSEALAGLSAVSEMIEQESIGPMLYYRLTLFAPYLYGLILAFLILVFPIVALMSLWPGWGKALVHFFTLWMSVKLWPVFWSWLSEINSSRMMSVFSDDPRGLVGTAGTGEMMTALAAMYILIPALSLGILTLVVSATGFGINQFLRGGETGNPLPGAARGIGGVVGPFESAGKGLKAQVMPNAGRARSGSGGSPGGSAAGAAQEAGGNQLRQS